MILRWQYRRAKHQDNHHLPAVEPAAHQHMAQQTVTGVLIVCLNFKRMQKPPDITDDRAGQLILDLTGIDIDDLMRSRFVYTRNDPSRCRLCR